MDNKEEKIEQMTVETKELQSELTNHQDSEKFKLIDKSCTLQIEEMDEIIDENMLSCIVDKDLQVKTISKAFCDLFGYTMLDFENKNFSIIIAPESAEKFHNGCEYVKNHGKESWGTELLLTTVDNKEISCNVIINPYFVENQLGGFIFVIHDISCQKLLHKLQVKMMSQEKFHQSTLGFISSTSAAVLDTVSTKTSLVVKIVVGFIFLFLIYAVSFDIDEIARGQGKFVPTANVQTIKNLEGGVVSEIFVKEGDSVKKGQILLNLSDVSYQSKFEENRIRMMELRAKEARLVAEINGLPMQKINCKEECEESMILNEKQHYLTNQQKLQENIAKQLEQLRYQESILKDTQNKYAVLSQNSAMLEKEFRAKKELESKKIFTKYELSQLERELNDALGEKKSAYEAINQTKAQIEEIKNTIAETKTIFRNDAASVLNETVAELLRLEEAKKNFGDMISRSVVRSPVDGVVKELFIHTIGSSIQPSSDILTIVPDNYEMVAEVKIKPEEIAKLHVGQAVKLKVTAFDYSIYGDLEAKIINISPDTITDKETGESHYLIYIKTKKNYLLDNEKYKIKVGMMVNADVLVGKKSIMSFLLKPILKTTQRE